MTEQGQLIQFDKLSIRVEPSEQQVYYVFSGEVDETFRQEDVPIYHDRSLILNLADVVNFNSVGIREWVQLVRKLSETGQPIVFRECSISFVDQINMVPDTKGPGVVESFYAPYYCSCGKEVNKLIFVADHRNLLQQGEAPHFSCECGKELEFDALEESYFQFLDVLPKVG